VHAIVTAVGRDRRVILVTACLTLVAALVFPASAGAESVSVQVTARIAPTFSLTILTSGAIAFGDVTVGAVYDSPDRQTLLVRSGLPWDFTDSSDAVISVGELTLPREQLVRHIVTPGFGDGLPAGIHEIDCAYVLDLTSPEALSLPAGTQITTTMGYTAVQR
jgi:hypothetical protein